MEIDFSTISMDFVIHTINIVVLFLLLRWLLFKPVSEYMHKRTQRIQADIDNAQKNSEETDALKVQYAKQLDSAKSEASQTVLATMTQADRDAKTIIAEAQDQARSIIADAQKAAQDERDHILQQMRGQIAALSVQIAGRVLEREVSQEDNRALIDSFFEQVG